MTKFLALDSSQLIACVCVIDEGVVVDEVQGSAQVAHSEALLPLIDQVLKKHALTEIDAFAVGIGPGSFTGIRIGCATMKALAQVRNKPILGFSSLKALVFSEDQELTPNTAAFVNAYQGNVFIGWQESVSRQWKDEAVLPLPWLKTVFHERTAPLKLCGSGVKVYQSELSAFPIQEGMVNSINSDGICRTIASDLILKGKEGAFRSHLTLAANYLRPSQAEIKLREHDRRMK